MVQNRRNLLSLVLSRNLKLQKASMNLSSDAELSTVRTLQQGFQLGLDLKRALTDS